MGSQTNLRDAHGFQEFGLKDLARVGGDAVGGDHGVTCSVVIGKAHIKSFRTLPSEDKAPLVVDSDAVKPDQISLQGFKVIVRRGFEVPKVHGGIQHVKFP